MEIRKMKYLTTRLSSFLKPVFAHPRYYSKIHTVMQDDKNYFTLPEMVRVLEKFAPLGLAEKWDNVGLLIEPSKPRYDECNERQFTLLSFIIFFNCRVVKSALLVNDLTEKVMENAIKSSVDLIISYHPPIFAPMKRISQR